MKIDSYVVDAVVGAHIYFNDIHKVALWFQLDNPSLGGVSPNFLINCGRAKKLTKFINAALDEYKSLNPPRQKKDQSP